MNPLRTVSVAEAIKKQNDVALILSSYLFSTKAKHSNTVFSPASINAALTLAASGPNGSSVTHKILSFLRSSSTDELNAVFKEIVSVVFADHSANGGPKISSVNGVWIEETLRIDPSFKDLFENFFKVAFGRVDFRNKAEALRIELNSWASYHTNGLIKDLLPPGSVTDLTDCVYGNALYFKGAWEVPFDKLYTRDEEFHLLNGISVSVPFMSSYKDQYIQAYDGFKVLRLPYRQGGYVTNHGLPFGHGGSFPFGQGYGATNPGFHFGQGGNATNHPGFPFGQGGNFPFGQGGNFPFGQGGTFPFGQGGSFPFGQGADATNRGLPFGQGGSFPFGQGADATNCGFPFGQGGDATNRGFPFVQGSDATNCRFSMYFYLPDKKDGLDDLVKTMASTPGFLDSHVPRRKEDVDQFRIPKFKIDYRLNGEDLGFCSSVPLYHKACVEIDEEGAEAAAATFVECGVGCSAYWEPPKTIDFVADHPFLFVIREDKTGTVLFVGQIFDPSDKSM